MGSSTSPINPSLLLAAAVVTLLLAGACTDWPGAPSLGTTSPTPTAPEARGEEDATDTPTPSPTPTRTPATQRFTLTLIVDPPGAGFVAILPPFSPYRPGTFVTLSIIPPRVFPYAFSHWSGDASGSDRTATVIMDSNKIVVANFFNPAITPAPSPGGVITLRE